jgi:hypothetical protein
MRALVAGKQARQLLLVAPFRWAAEFGSSKPYHQPRFISTVPSFYARHPLDGNLNNTPRRNLVRR